MIRRIRLKNFMSHADTTLELADGLTVLVGPNNCGKSAVVSALNLLSTLPGREGGYMVRHGQKTCRVEVTTSDGQTVAWARTNSPSVEVNGEAIPRISQDQANALARVHAVLRLPQVVVEDGKYSFDIHFGQQKSPVFLLDQPSSRAAVFFAASSDAQRLLEMQTVFKNKVKAKKQESNQLAADMERLDTDLQRLAPLADIAPHLEKLQQEHESIRRLLEELKDRESRLAALEEASTRARAIDARVEALSTLHAPPTLDDDAALEDLYTTLQKATATAEYLGNQLGALLPLKEPPTLGDDITLARDLATLNTTTTTRRQLHDQVAVYKTLDDPPRLEDAEALDALATAINQGEVARTDLSTRIAVLVPLEQPPALVNTDEAAQLVDLIDELRQAQDRLSTRHHALTDLNPPPEFADPAPMADLLAELTATMERHRRIDSRAGAIAGLVEPPLPAETAPLEGDIRQLEEWQALRTKRERLLAEADEELRNWVQEHPFCPTCGAEMNAGKILAGGNGHDHS